MSRDPEDFFNPATWQVQMHALKAHFKQNEIIIKLLQGLQGVPEQLANVNENLRLIHASRPVSSPDDTLHNLERLSEETAPKQPYTGNNQTPEAAHLPTETPDVTPLNPTMAPPQMAPMTSQTTPATPRSAPVTPTHTLVPIVTPEAWFFRNSLKQTAEANRQANHPDWDRQLKLYQNVTFQFLRNMNLSTLYDDWSKESPPYAVKKLLPKVLPSDSEKRARLKMDQATANLRFEINFMREVAQEKSDQRTKIDEAMKRNRDLGQRNLGEVG